MTRVVDETQCYYDAQTHSVDAADEGFAFANDAMEFCGRLAEATEPPRRDSGFAVLKLVDRKYYIWDTSGIVNLSLRHT